MADWLGIGAAVVTCGGYDWRPTWACGSNVRWLQSASSCGGGGGLRSGASSAYTDLLVVVDLLVRRLSVGWC